MSPSSPLRSLFPLYVVIFFGFVGYSLMITVFTPMLLGAHGGFLPADATVSRRALVLGIVLCLYPGGQFLGSPVLGALSDRYGRKPVLILSLAATTACYALIATALGLTNLPLLCLSLFLAGLGEANVVTAQSAISDVVTKADRTRFFGYIYMAASLAYIVGPLAGGKLAEPSLGSWFGNATPFWLVAGLLALTTGATFLLFQETNPPGRRQRVGYLAAFTTLAGVVTDRRIRALYFVNFLLYLAIFGFFRCYPMYLVDEFQLGVSRESELIAWVGVPIVLANLWLTGYLSRRAAVRTLTVWSAALTGAFMVLVVVPRAPGALWVTLFLTSLALAVCLPSCATMLSISVGEADQGRVMGNNQALQVGAESLSGILGGLLAAIMVKLSLIVLGAIAIVAAGALLLHRGRACGTG
ncbi:MAG TPA: MFS transporter [Candidatus Methylomirabilis sp.]|nr:MFS transporter [Candidatus Methylomirabilis sp.]